MKISFLRPQSVLVLLRTIAWLGVIFASLPAQAQNTTVDVTSQFTISRSGYVYNRATNSFDAVVTITNNKQAVASPITLVVTSVTPASVSLANGTGLTPDGKLFVPVLVSGSELPTGGKSSAVLKFSNPSRVSFNYTVQVNAASPADIGKDVSFSGPPPLPVEGLNALPKNPNTGRPILFEMPQGSLEFDNTLRDAITAKGECTGWITACIKPGERELDDCARSVPKCKTSTPWLEDTSCCPSSCFEQYRTKRLAGTQQIEAFVDVYLDDETCFPQSGDTP